MGEAKSRGVLEARREEAIEREREAQVNAVIAIDALDAQHRDICGQLPGGLFKKGAVEGDPEHEVFFHACRVADRAMALIVAENWNDDVKEYIFTRKGAVADRQKAAMGIPVKKVRTDEGGVPLHVTRAAVSALGSIL